MKGKYLYYDGLKQGKQKQQWISPSKSFDSIDGGYFVECLWYKRCESNWDEDVSEREYEIDQANKKEKHESDVANKKDQFIGEINETANVEPIPRMSMNRHMLSPMTPTSLNANKDCELTVGTMMIVTVVSLVWSMMCLPIFAVPNRRQILNQIRRKSMIYCNSVRL